MNVSIPADFVEEKMKESEKIDKYLDLARELKKTVGTWGDCDTNCS